MSSPLRPPRRPITAADRDFQRGLRISLIAHGVLLSFIVLKSLVFPDKPIPYIPTLRVDLVGLPDQLKNERIQQPAPAAAPEPTKAPPPKEEPKAKAKTEVAEPDEMVLKAKRLKEENARKEAQRLAKAKKEEEERKKRISNALARVRALEKITGEQTAQQAKPGTPVKGNILSPGSSLSGDARESSEASYYDSLRARLQENWALPVWLARQNLSAQVQIYIDSRGNLRNFRFMKLSGNTQFDEAVKKAMTESQPFPVPPEKLMGSLLVDGILVGFPL